MEIQARYKSAVEACKRTGIPEKNMYAALQRGFGHKTGGYIFVYEDIYIENTLHSKQSLQAKWEVKGVKAVNQYDLRGNYIRTFNSEEAVCEVYKKINKYSLKQACIGGLKTTGGFQWRYKDSKRPVGSLKQQIAV